ncbi:MAG: 30S ribosome-binding factor RbfA [Rubrobacter sp.]|nr:30S ribosome-binding factor RbfA [Rubrobacter sp.]
MSERIRKVESRLKEIVGEEVASLSDPRIKGLVTVTNVRVSPDLRQATIYYSLLSGENIEGAREGLQSSAGRIQAAVAAQTRLKHTPRLRFEQDPVVENVSRVEAALRKLKGMREDAVDE